VRVSLRALTPPTSCRPQADGLDAQLPPSISGATAHARVCMLLAQHKGEPKERMLAFISYVLEELLVLEIHVLLGTYSFGR